MAWGSCVLLTTTHRTSGVHNGDPEEHNVEPTADVRGRGERQRACRIGIRCGCCRLNRATGKHVLHQVASSGVATFVLKLKRQLQSIQLELKSIKPIGGHMSLPAGWMRAHGHASMPHLTFGEAVEASLDWRRWWYCNVQASLIIRMPCSRESEEARAKRCTLKCKRSRGAAFITSM